MGATDICDYISTPGNLDDDTTGEKWTDACCPENYPATQSCVLEGRFSRQRKPSLFIEDLYGMSVEDILAGVGYHAKNGGNVGR